MGGAGEGGGASQVSALLTQSLFSNCSKAPVSRHPEKHRQPSAQGLVPCLVTYTIGNGNGGGGNNGGGGDPCL